VQIQVLLLLRELQRELGLAVIFVTHDIGVATEIADRIAVMYAVASSRPAPAATSSSRPRHPYTVGLLASRAGSALAKGERLAAIPAHRPISPICERLRVRAALHAGTAVVRERGAGGCYGGDGHRARCVLLQGSGVVAG